MNTNTAAIEPIEEAESALVKSGETIQLITVTIGDEEYGVDIMEVREIKAWTETTTLPNTPKFVRGVINLRGAVLPIYDLRARFGLGLTEPTKLHVVVIVAVEDKSIGILVDAVSDILIIPKDEIRAVPEMERSIDEAYLSGLVTVEGRMVALLAVEKLFELENET